MCGIAGIFGAGYDPAELRSMVTAQHHRGPDSQGLYEDPRGQAGLGHNRLSIIDLSPAGRQPMSDQTGQRFISFNGEIYNYLELRASLSDYSYRSRTDTEVILAAYARWGEASLDRLLGMFSFLIWDEKEQRLFAARDRFGVKPLYYHQRRDGTLFVASEIKALFAAGVPARPDPVAWATYLTSGHYDHTDRTFWQDIKSLPAGHWLSWQAGEVRITNWYDLAARIDEEHDPRPLDTVKEEYLGLLKESVRLRFRADVPVGINLSGGLDSSTLLGTVRAVQGERSTTKAFTFITGDPAYDELPWVVRMLEHSWHPLEACRLRPEEVPDLASSVQSYQDEPFGGLPTLAYARLFETARAGGIIVLLDGQGMDEQWAGYDYYAASLNGGGPAATIQGVKERPVQPACLIPEFRRQAELFDPPRPFPDDLRNLQYRDAKYTKIPRALRFNDRVSMRSSTELREPFLDHRLFELAFRQPVERKIDGGTSKWLLRRVARRFLPDGIVEAPKRPLQTPQREWLRNQLRDWAGAMIEQALVAEGGSWLDAGAVRATWEKYCRGESDNSFYVWQWISLGLTVEQAPHLRLARTA